MQTGLGALAAIVAACVFVLASATAQDAGPAFRLNMDESGVQLGGDLQSAIAGVTGGGESGGWLSRVRGGYDYHSDGVSRGWAETIQPLHQTESSAVFVQGRLAYAREDATLNVGGGYRTLTPGQTFMLGVNGFYDVSVDQQHQRYSIGAEALGPFFTARANWYEGISDWKLIAPGIQEKALGGADVSLDAQAPYMPWLRVGARYFEWRGEAAADAEGVQGTVSADITDLIQFVGTFGGDEDPEGDYYLGLRLRLRGDNRPTAARQFWSTAAFDRRVAANHMLDFVERENRIITETQGGSFASGTITVSRGE